MIDYICQGKRPHQHKITTWATLVTISTDCSVAVFPANIFLRGPKNLGLRSKDEHDFIDIRKSLIVHLEDTFNPKVVLLERILTNKSRKTRHLPDFHINSTVLQASWNNSYLTSFVQKLWEAQYRLDYAVSRLEDHSYFVDSQMNLWKLFNLIGNFTQVIATLVVILSLLSYSRFFGLLSVTIIDQNFAKANPFKDDSLRPGEDLVLSGYTPVYVNSACYGVFILLILMMIFRSWFRRVKICSYNGRVKNKPRLMDHSITWAINLNIIARFDYLTYSEINNVYLRVPITCLTPDRIHEVKVVNTVNTWYTFKSKKYGLVLRLAAPVKFIAIDKEGERFQEGKQYVEFYMKDVQWFGTNEPTSLKKTPTVNQLAISVVKGLSESTSL